MRNGDLRFFNADLGQARDRSSPKGGRAFLWGLFFPEGQTYGGYAHREYEEMSKGGFYSDGDDLRAQLFRDLPIVYKSKKPNVLTKVYATVTHSYAVPYPYLVFVGFVAAIVLLLAGNFVAALPALFYFFNVVAHAYLGVPLGRYIQPIDTLLMFSIVAAAAQMLPVASLERAK